MNKPLVITLAVLGSIILLALGVGAGLLLAHGQYANSVPYTSYMHNWDNHYNQPFNNGWMNDRYGRMGSPMDRRGYGVQNSASAAPLTADQVRTAVDGYLANLNNPDLQLAEIMIFDNNAYARITEKSTGIGAMELLVDPGTLAVYPEYGPNMMWNMKYGHMAGYGMMGGRGGMMGYGYGFDDCYPANATGEDMTVTADQALQYAQAYLDQNFPGYQTAADADPFYGYYTIDIMKDGNPTGMLSVNGYTGQVFLHTWHGTFIEMDE